MKRNPNRDNSKDTGSPGNLEDMEINITKLPDWVARRIVEIQEITQDLVTQEPMFYEN